MTEAVVAFLLIKLNELITQETSLLSGVDEQVRLLKDRLEWMRLFLKEVDIKQRKDEKLKLSAKQIRDVAYHAEDVIDEFIVEFNIQRGNMNNTCGFVSSSRGCITCTHKLPILHGLAKQIKEINTTIDQISSNRSIFDISHTEVGESSTTLSSYGGRKSQIIEGDVVGIEDSIREVKSMLIEGGLQRKVVSIIGMCGIGKTTLAKKVYDDVHGSFAYFAFVRVSRNYQIKDILQSIIKGVGNDQKMKNNLRKKLRERLQDCKYLIVLDDLWSIEAWDVLNTIFPDKGNGSRILLTTRSRTLALYAGGHSSQNIHELRLLNDLESWELFQRKIFRIQNHIANSDHHFGDLGRRMAARCHGLPLAIVVLGGLLSTKDNILRAWSQVNDTISYTCEGILASSYYDLPYYLKPVFIYFGVFPEDHEIPVSLLIKYWVAEGFVQRKGEETMEDVAEDYLEELINRSMIQVVERKSDGRVKKCRIHDLLRDLAIQKAKDDQFFQVYGKIDFENSMNVRRLTIHSDTDIDKAKQDQIFQDRYIGRLRSLIYFDRRSSEALPWKSIYPCFKLLRVLELQHTGISTLPKQIGQLIHLKYLGLKSNNLKMLPCSIGKLSNLQTLDLRKNFNIKCMPIDIWSLHKIRHLYIEQSPCLPVITIWDKLWMKMSHPLGIGNLKNLQTLHIHTGNWIEDGGLGSLSLILRKLVLFGSLVPYKEVMSDSIANLKILRTLELHDCIEVPALEHFSHLRYLYKLHLNGCLGPKLPESPCLFPHNLKKLILSRSLIENDPMVILEKLPYLRVLQLCDYSYLGKEMVCSNGGFPSLQVLQIIGLTGLEEWTIEKGALASLTHLIIARCKLKMLPDGLLELTQLEELELLEMSHELMARVEKNIGEDWNKIERIPTLRITSI